MDIYELITSVAVELLRGVLIDVVSEHVGRRIRRVLAGRAAQRRRRFYAGMAKQKQKRLLHRLCTEVEADATRT